MTSRRPVHFRSIHVEAFLRDDGLWDLEASLLDRKSRDFELASGVRPAGDAIHDLRLTVTIDQSFNIVDASAQTLASPYPRSCGAYGDAYRRLVGLNLVRDFRRRVRERLGGVAGCTHLTELTDALPTAAFQAFAGEVVPPEDKVSGGADAGAPLQRPFQLDRCHALRIDGPAVARYYPRWFRDPAQKAAGTDPATD